MGQADLPGPGSGGRGAGRGLIVGIATGLIITCLLLAVRVDFGAGDVAVAIFAGVIAGVSATWLGRATSHTPSTRAGTTGLMFALAVLTALGGLIAGVVCMIHTSSPGCEGWVGCGTDHPLMGVGVLCIVLAFLLAAGFGALGLIARSVGEMQAASLTSVHPNEPRYPSEPAGTI